MSNNPELYGNYVAADIARQNAENFSRINSVMDGREIAKLRDEIASLENELAKARNGVSAWRKRAQELEIELTDVRNWRDAWQQRAQELENNLTDVSIEASAWKKLMPNLFADINRQVAAWKLMATFITVYPKVIDRIDSPEKKWKMIMEYFEEMYNNN